MGDGAHRVAVLNVVGLTQALLGADSPRLQQFLRRARLSNVAPAFPAVTCTAQSNYLTGALPSRHGIVGNGWYNRELAEIHFWKQSNHLVGAPKIWDAIKAAAPSATCAQLFWWFNMYSGADYSITPRPMYPADGRKIFDIYTRPSSIRNEIKAELGEFPFPAFWGPAAGLDRWRGGADAASRWIAQSARWIEQKYAPTLSLVYLPHLDYNYQRFGPHYAQAGQDLRQIDAIVGDLIDFFQGRGVRVIVLSEYGLAPVEQPLFLNRLFREHGWLAIREELGRERLDPGASAVFCVADHQAAHVYLNDSSLEKNVRETLQKQPGIERVLGRDEKEAWGLDHPRAGDLVAIAAERAWFSYYFWLDDRAAPDFARTVDIHRKPGYDPAELFLDPKIPFVQLKALARLAQKRLGFRMLMDVIPLQAELVRGSHGRRPSLPSEFPLLILDSKAGWAPPPEIDSTAVFGVIRRAVCG